MLQPATATPRAIKTVQRGIMAYLIATGRLIFRLWHSGRAAPDDGESSMKRVCIPVVCLVLAGCAGSASDKWTKPGIKAETADTAFSACQDQARRPNQRDAGVCADITATLGQIWHRAAALAIKRDEMATLNHAPGHRNP